MSEAEKRLANEIRERKLTYLNPTKIATLLDATRRLEARNVPGLFMEAGCALGGSSALIAKSKAAARPFNIYDVFGMIPPPTAEDAQDVHDRYRAIIEGKSKGLGGSEYYGYRDDLYETVRTNLMSFGIDLERDKIKLIKGLVQETLNLEGPVAFAHIDVDWYESVMTCLERIYPRLSVGGIIILDDYHDWSGCRKATDEFLGTMAGSFIRDDSARSLKITKVADPR